MSDLEPFKAVIGEMYVALVQAERELSALRAAVGSGVMTDATIKNVRAAIAKAEEKVDV